MSEPTLKSCPFCGSEAKLEVFYGKNNYAQYKVECTKCYISKSWSTDKEFVISAWNRRA